MYLPVSDWPPADRFEFDSLVTPNPLPVAPVTQWLLHPLSQVIQASHGAVGAVDHRYKLRICAVCRDWALPGAARYFRRMFGLPHSSLTRSWDILISWNILRYLIWHLKMSRVEVADWRVEALRPLNSQRERGHRCIDLPTTDASSWEPQDPKAQRGRWKVGPGRFRDFGRHCRSGLEAAWEVNQSEPFGCFLWCCVPTAYLQSPIESL